MRLYSYLKCFANLTKSELMKLNTEDQILLNGKKVPLSTEVGDSDLVTLRGMPVLRQETVYYLYYKPRGILSTVSERKESYIHYMPEGPKLSPAGRLDKDSEGLLLLSNDGKFLNEITGPKTHYEKEYIVTVEKEITEMFMEDIQKSYHMDNRITKPAIARKIDSHTVSMILSEGLYHQIRRIVKESGNRVTELKRIRIGNYRLSDMKPGELRKTEKNR